MAQKPVMVHVGMGQQYGIDRRSMVPVKPDTLGRSPSVSDVFPLCTELSPAHPSHERQAEIENDPVAVGIYLDAIPAYGVRAAMDDQFHRQLGYATPDCEPNRARSTVLIFPMVTPEPTV
jgi:hypothetical protein